eukprot:TRINITY_DN1066_c0_g1_i7.p2 TRINITY_DN1066_c0_g1~~TRINITY_DN1066_c0_g1_i7.p2  ORF type:complete len:121 (+),score=21.57 TRINITY_DN1066_c0_g1_i7:1753-2115(+)
MLAHGFVIQIIDLIGSSEDRLCLERISRALMVLRSPQLKDEDMFVHLLTFLKSFILFLLQFSLHFSHCSFHVPTPSPFAFIPSLVSPPSIFSSFLPFPFQDPPFPSLKFRIEEEPTKKSS